MKCCVKKQLINERHLSSFQLNESSNIANVGFLFSVVPDMILSFEETNWR